LDAPICTTWTTVFREMSCTHPWFFFKKISGPGVYISYLSIDWSGSLQYPQQNSQYSSGHSRHNIWSSLPFWPLLFFVLVIGDLKGSELEESWAAWILATYFPKAYLGGISSFHVSGYSDQRGFFLKITFRIADIEWNCSIVGEKTRSAQSQCFHQWRATLQQIIKNFHLFHFFPVITQDVEASEDISRETDEFDSIRRVILSFFRWNTREEREPDPKNKTQFIYRYEDDFSFVNRAQRWYMANWRMQGYPWLLSPRWAYGYPGEQESDTLTIFAVRMLNVRLYPRRCLSPADSLHAYLHDTWISEYQLDNIEKRPRI